MIFYLKVHILEKNSYTIFTILSFDLFGILVFESQ